MQGGTGCNFPQLCQLARTLLRVAHRVTEIGVGEYTHSDLLFQDFM